MEDNLQSGKPESSDTDARLFNREGEPRAVHVDVPKQKKVTKTLTAWHVQADNCSCSFFQWAEFDDDGNPPWV